MVPPGAAGDVVPPLISRGWICTGDRWRSTEKHFRMPSKRTRSTCTHPGVTRRPARYRLQTAWNHLQTPGNQLQTKGNHLHMPLESLADARESLADTRESLADAPGITCRRPGIACRRTRSHLQTPGYSVGNNPQIRTAAPLRSHPSRKTCKSTRRHLACSIPPGCCVT